MVDVDTDALFEAYPHIAKKIQFSWGSPECRKFLNELLTDSRDGARVGFPIHHAKTIYALQNRHDDLYPQFINIAAMGNELINFHCADLPSKPAMYKVKEHHPWHENVWVKFFVCAVAIGAVFYIIAH